MGQDLKINKGVELMLRRDKREPEPERKGLKLNHTVNLLRKRFNLKIEFTWGDNSN
jgi:hypothetical protein